MIEGNGVETHGNVISIAVAPHGKQIVFGTTDGTVTCWEVDHLRTSFPPIVGAHEGIINSVCYSSDAHLVASASDDKAIRIWDAETGSAMACFSELHADGVLIVGPVYGMGTMVSLSRDNVVHVWKAQTGDVENTFHVFLNSQSIAALSRDGKKLLTASRTGIITWNTITGESIKEIAWQIPMVLCAGFSPDAEKIVFGLGDNVIQSWDLEKSEVDSFPFEGHEEPPLYVMWSPNGKTIASVAQDNSLRIWDAKTRKCILGPCGIKGPFAYSHDSNLILFPGVDNSLDTFEVPVVRVVYKYLFVLLIHFS
ncbi:hypothetical protein ID866_7423 [Astraeus odoratus]|nr:hypothetical protein ID866_7423 [Astraeus odoratus]